MPTQSGQIRRPLPPYAQLPIAADDLKQNPLRHALGLGDDFGSREAQRLNERSRFSDDVTGGEISDDGHASVQMTLTTPHCPVAESMPGEVELRVGSVPGIGDAEVNLVWDPPWDPQKMSDEAKLELGML